MRLFVGAAIAVGAACAQAPGWRLVLEDDFSGPLNTSLWSHYVGPYRAGCYEPSAVGTANGSLFIEASYTPKARCTGSSELRDWTAGSINTSLAFTQLYGRWEARLKGVVGLGLHPAWWLMPDVHSGLCWPTGGEIDIVEQVAVNSAGPLTSAAGCNVHIGTQCDVQIPHGPIFNSREDDWAATWHEWAVEWNETSLVYLLDNQTVSTFIDANVTSRLTIPMYAILSMAVMEPPYGPPDPTKFPLPQRMMVDYVRVYTRE